MFEKDFPILKRKIGGRRLVYLDNAATTQKPQSVIEAVSRYYERSNANIHRDIHTLSEEATSAYEEARDSIKNFINASHREEVIFTSGTTESINLVAATWGEKNIKAGDEIVLTEMEHHANLVPWQILAKKKGAKLKFIPIDKNGHLDITAASKLITHNSKLLTLAHISNVLGTINPVKEIITEAHKAGAIVLIDGAQAIAHEKVNVREIDCDFYAFSGHKMYGPTGIGVLYGKKELLEDMPPYQTGGGMIRKVTKDESVFAPLPEKFEAGTPNIAGAVGLGAAVEFLKSCGLERVKSHELKVMNYALDKLNEIPEIEIYGPAKLRAPVIAFNIKNIPPHDLASILDQEGVAIRAGHHCAMPLHEKLGIPASARASFAMYNTEEDVDALIIGIKKAIKIFHD